MYRLLTSEAETPSLVCDFISWSFFFPLSFLHLSLQLFVFLLGCFHLAVFRDNTVLVPVRCM